MEKILKLKEAAEAVGLEATLYPNMEFVGRDMKTRRCIGLDIALPIPEDEDERPSDTELCLIFHPDTYELLDDNLKCPLVE